MTTKGMITANREQRKPIMDYRVKVSERVTARDETGSMFQRTLPSGTLLIRDLKQARKISEFVQGLGHNDEGRPRFESTVFARFHHYGMPTIDVDVDDVDSIGQAFSEFLSVLHSETERD